MRNWRGFLLKCLIFLASLAVFFIFSRIFTAHYDVTGDEPHYLMITHSLAWDGDLDLANNFQARDYRRFFPVRYLGGHRLRHPDGRLYSAHGFGLPVILTLPYRLGGLKGARFMMMIIGAFLAAGVYGLSRQLGLSNRGAVFSWLAASFTLPLVFFSFMIFNELPAALLFVWSFGAVLSLGDAEAGPAREFTSKLVILLAAVYWPWLHFRYGLFSIFILVLLILRVWPGRIKGSRSFLGLIVLLLLADAALLYFYFVFLYQSWIPPMFGVSVVYGRFWQGILGLLFDRAAGLIFFSPIYGLALAGLVNLIWRGQAKIETGLLTGLIVFYAAALGSYYRWDAGTSPVGRYLVPILPFLAVAVGAAYEAVRANRRVWLIRIIWLASFFLAAAGLIHRVAIYANREGINYYAQALARSTGLDLAGLLPGLYPAAASYRTAFIWLIFFLILNLPFIRLSSDQRQRSA